MMAMVRLNVPSVFLYGGSILPGRFRGRDVTVLDLFEAVGRHSAGKMGDAELHELECVACPSAGACGGQFTANTMACVSEAIGLALPGSAGAPAPYESRDSYAEASGRAVMNLLAQKIRPRDIVTRKSLENAAVVVAATGGSTNAALHLPAIAHEAGIDFHLMEVAEVFKRTPYLADLKPGGRFVAKDMFEAGGMPVLLKTLLDGGFLHGDCLTVTGKTIAENLEGVTFRSDQEVIRPYTKPLLPTGGLVGLKGSLAPDGAIVKVAGLKKLKFRGPARVFDCEEDCFAAVDARNYKAGDVLVIRYEGPKGGPGMREMLSTTLGDLRAGDGRAGCSDHGRSLLRRDPRILHRSRWSGSRRRRADRPSEDGDVISIDAETGVLDVEVSPAEMAERAKAFRPRTNALPDRDALEVRTDRRDRRKGRGDASRRQSRSACLRGHLARRAAKMVRPLALTPQKRQREWPKN